MPYFLKARFYNLLIEPLVAGLKHAVVSRTINASKVIDIACGTGTLAFAIGERGSLVTALDLDSEMIAFAQERALEKGINNVRFVLGDASDLSLYQDNEFDVSVTSMAIHQFEEGLAVSILSEMKRISGKVVIADYNCPLPAGLSGKVASGIERLAGGDHYRNFRNYMQRGGLKWFTGSAGFEIRSEMKKGNGVFLVMECA
jgi:ubiquinone/menaquinone biosynthesis C-methylase UbiE